MREGLTTAGEVTGSAFVTYGCFEISRPFGFIVGGLLLAIGSWLVDH